jgi:hypothetical protein
VLLYAVMKKFSDRQAALHTWLSHQQTPTRTGLYSTTCVLVYSNFSIGPLQSGLSIALLMTLSSLRQTRSRFLGPVSTLRTPISWTRRFRQACCLHLHLMAQTRGLACSPCKSIKPARDRRFKRAKFPISQPCFKCLFSPSFPVLCPLRGHFPISHPPLLPIQFRNELHSHEYLSTL